jgi:DnaK suppressor protein
MRILDAPKWRISGVEEALKNTKKYFKTVLTRMLDERWESKAEHCRTRESSERRPDMIDWAVQDRDREMNLRIRERDFGLVGEIIRALSRIEQGTYGICASCEDEIGLERLKASPVATLCIECKKKEEARSRTHADFRKVSEME